jgi:hypothetical protein
MSTSTAAAGTKRRRPPAAAILVVPLLAAIIITLFAWPSARQEPRDLPIAVAGTPAATAQIEQRLAAQDGAFDVHRFADEAAARQAIEDREVYGAFVVTPAGPKVLTASGASANVAQMLTRATDEAMHARAAEAQGGPAAAAIPVEDVVEAGTASSGLSAAILPLVITGIITGLISGLLATGAVSRIGFLVVGSVLAGLVAAALIQSWLDVVAGDWAVNAGVLSLMVLAVGSVFAGLQSLFGQAGVIVTSIIMVLVGNPFSAVATGPEMLPDPVGGIGQLLPPGAGGNLLRSTGFFDGAAAAEPLFVLGTWIALGLGGIGLAALRSRRRESPAGAQVPVPA